MILGINPDTNVTGYGIIEIPERKPSMVAMGMINIRKTDGLCLRLGHISDRTTSIINECLPGEMIIEAPLFRKNVQSMLELGRVQGAVIVAAIHHDVPTHEYASLKIKMAIIGQGQAGKEQVAGMLRRLLKTSQGEMPHFTDATDALGAAYCYLLQMGRPSVDNKCHGWRDFINRNKSRPSHPSTK